MNHDQASPSSRVPNRGAASVWLQTDGGKILYVGLQYGHLSIRDLVHHVGTIVSFGELTANLLSGGFLEVASEDDM
jgi:hypothetical protein